MDTPESSLNFEIEDSSNNKFNINIIFSNNLKIKAKNENSFPIKVYNGSFSLEELKNKSKFFKMFDSIPETFNDIKLISEQKSFFIKSYDKSIALCIKKQIGIQNDIIFSLNEQSSDIKEIVTKLCEKNINLEKRVNELEIQIKNLMEVTGITGLLLNDEKVIKNFFDKTPKNLIYIYDSNLFGFDREIFLDKCEGKNNLLFLVEDNNGNKFGGYMSSKFIKNNKGSEEKIRDENSFIFSIQKNKKFRVIKPQSAININDNYLICFGGSFSEGNDLYIGQNKSGGMNRKDYYGDNNYETSNGQSSFSVKELKVFKINF